LATTNDFSPVCNGQYTFWATEELAYPGTSTQWGHQSGQNLSYTQLGTIISVLEGQYTGTALPGSLDYEIVLSQTAAPYATAIRLGDMNVGRTAVGGIITP
jgi:hypothetical protein